MQKKIDFTGMDSTNDWPAGPTVQMQRFTEKAWLPNVQARTSFEHASVALQLVYWN